MNFLFANVALLPLAVLVAIPVLLHLFARARPPVLPFSSLWFLRRIVREQHRVRKPRDWLLLALRTLLFAALIAAFLQPLWFGGTPAAPGAGRSIVLIVDATASMSVREGAQSRFAAACAEAADVLSGLSSRDRANLIWLRSPPRAVFPQPGVNFGFLRESLRQGRVSSEAGDPAAALRLAGDMLRNTAGRREICIVSDFQQTTWRNLGADVAPGVEVVTIPVAGRPAENLAITRLTARPAAPLAGEDVQVFVEVRNYGAAPRLATVQGEIGELHASQPLQVPAWGRATIAFRARCPHPGPMLAAANLGEDDFPDDNRAWQIVGVKPGLRVGLLATDAATAAYWRQAVRALPWAQLAELPDAGWAADAEGCDALLLCGWDGTEPAAARAALAAGRPVIWYPARGTAAAHFAALTGAQASGPLAWREAHEPSGLEIAAPDDPLFALFAGGDHGNPAGGVFRGRLDLPAPPAGASVLLRYRDGAPGLVRLGNLVVWNLGLAPEISGWASRMEFLPLFGELLLTSRGDSAEAGGALVTGQELVFRTGRDTRQAALSLENPDGTPREVSRRDEPGSTASVAGRAEKPGLYVWRLGGEVALLTAVNFPPEESDLRTLPPPAIAKSGWAAVSGGRAARERRDGVPVWPLCLGVALACGLGEAVVAWWAAKK